MRFQCDQEELLGAVQAAGRAVSPRANQPALTGLLVRAERTDDASRVVISGTDHNLSIVSAVKASVDSAGEALIPARFFGEIIKNVTPGAVTVETRDDGSEVSVSTGRTNFNLRMLPAENFPHIPAPSEIEGQRGSEMEVGDLEEAINQVATAASTDEARPVLTGVLITATGDGIRLVATDSYRLAIRDLTGGAEIAGEGGSLVPARALVEVGRMLKSEKSKTVRIFLGERDAGFEIETSGITTRLIDGEFPDYEKLIPAEFPNKLSLPKEEFLEAIKRIGTLAQQNTPLRIACSSEGVVMSVREQNVGEGSEELPEAKYEGDDLTIAFNPNYLRDGVSASPGDWIAVDIVDELKAALISGRETSSYRYLLMPIRI